MATLREGLEKMEKKASSGLSGYKTLTTLDEVKVQIPKHPQFNEAHSFKNQDGRVVNVPDHHRDGFTVAGNSKIIVNRHFYGLSADDFGRSRLANVEVVEKTTGDHRKFVLLNITIHEGKPGDAKYELKFKEDANGIPIPGTDTKVVFVPL